jgi:hypothetical protein
VVRRRGGSRSPGDLRRGGQGGECSGEVGCLIRDVGFFLWQRGKAAGDEGGSGVDDWLVPLRVWISPGVNTCARERGTREMSKREVGVLHRAGTDGFRRRVPRTPASNC